MWAGSLTFHNSIIHHVYFGQAFRKRQGQGEGVPGSTPRRAVAAPTSLPRPTTTAGLPATAAAGLNQPQQYSQSQYSGSQYPPQQYPPQNQYQQQYQQPQQQQWGPPPNQWQPPPPQQQGFAPPIPQNKPNSPAPPVPQNRPTSTQPPPPQNIPPPYSEKVYWKPAFDAARQYRRTSATSSATTVGETTKSRTTPTRRRTPSIMTIALSCVPLSRMAAIPQLV